MHQCTTHISTFYKSVISISFFVKNQKISVVCWNSESTFEITPNYAWKKKVKKEIIKCQSNQSTSAKSCYCLIFSSLHMDTRQRKREQKCKHAHCNITTRKTQKNENKHSSSGGTVLKFHQRTSTSSMLPHFAFISFLILLALHYVAAAAASAPFHHPSKIQFTTKLDNFQIKEINYMQPWCREAKNLPCVYSNTNKRVK